MRWSWSNGVSLWALGLLESRRVPEVAAAALEEGLDTPGLRSLAGLTGATGDDLRSEFAGVLESLGAPLPSRAHAARTLAKTIASWIDRGEIDPFEAARQLAVISRAVGEDFHELDLFIYAESEAEERPEDREFFANEIRREARRWTT